MAAIALTGFLGHWQQERVSEKRALQHEYETRRLLPPVSVGARTRDPALRYRRALAEGEWQATGQIFVDNQVQRNVAGYHVITPLKLLGTESVVLVNRGWVPRGPSYPAPPPVEVPPGRVTVAGHLSLPITRFVELSSHAVEGTVWQNLTIERYRNATKRDVLPFVLLEQSARLPLEVVTEQPDARAEKNLEYMLTWYALAITVILLWAVLSTKRVSPTSPGSKERTESPGRDSSDKGVES